jgi:hypothetical protein
MSYVSLIIMKQLKQETALLTRDRLAAAFSFTPEIVRGSLVHRFVRHRTGCATCASGKGHPVWVLTVGYPGGRTRQFSLNAEQKPVVEQWLHNYHKLKESLEQICESNLALLRAEKSQ